MPQYPFRNVRRPPPKETPHHRRRLFGNGYGWLSAVQRQLISSTLLARSSRARLRELGLERAGFSPRRPRSDEPQYDLSWQDGETTWVAEVKSLTQKNEERQLRLALGQVLRYRQLLAADDRDVRAAIVVEHAPGDMSWRQLCEQEGAMLLWPGEMRFGLTASA